MTKERPGFVPLLRNTISAAVIAGGLSVPHQTLAHIESGQFSSLPPLEDSETVGARVCRYREIKFSLELKGMLDRDYYSVAYNGKKIVKLEKRVTNSEGKAVLIESDSMTYFSNRSGPNTSFILKIDNEPGEVGYDEYSFKVEIPHKQITSIFEDPKNATCLSEALPTNGLTIPNGDSFQEIQYSPELGEAIKGVFGNFDNHEVEDPGIEFKLH